MSSNDGKKPRTKGPRLPKLPKSPKRPKGPMTPGGGRFAATVPTTPAAPTRPSTPYTPAAPTMPTISTGARIPESSSGRPVVVQAPAMQGSPSGEQDHDPDALVFVSAALTAPQPITSQPSSSTLPYEVPSQAASQPAASVLVQAEIEALDGDGVDDFAALFAEVMDDDEPAKVSASVHPEARAFAPASNADIPSVEWDDDPDWDDNPPVDEPDEQSSESSGSSDAALAHESDEEVFDPSKYEDRDAGVEESVIAERSRNYLAIFTNEVKPMTIDERVAEARFADADRLHAFCYDSTSPRVVKAIMENVNVGFTHARLIMGNHHSTAGLEMVGRNVTFLRDARVQKALFKNAQATQGLLRRIVRQRPLQQVYALSISRDITAKVKTAVRLLFRKKFQQSSPEICAALIIKTEARCLGLLAGVPLHAKTCAILCSRPMHSTMMIQNLARFPATLPRVLEHMFRQPSVKRNTNLKNMILRHPNAPSQLKRSTR